MTAQMELYTRYSNYKPTLATQRNIQKLQKFFSEPKPVSQKKDSNR